MEEEKRIINMEEEKRIVPLCNDRRSTSPRLPHLGLLDTLRTVRTKGNARGLRDVVI